MRSLAIYDINLAWLQSDKVIRTHELHHQGSTAPDSPDSTKDLQDFLAQAYQEKVVVDKNGRHNVITGIYKLIAVVQQEPLKSLKSHLESAEEERRWRKKYVELTNDWNTDFEPGFEYSNAVVNRLDLSFLLYKERRMAAITREMLRVLPSARMPIWNLPDVALDANTIFIMRGDTARVDPGLNVLMTGDQIRKMIMMMGQKLKVNWHKTRRLLLYILLLVPLWLIYHVIKSVWKTIPGSKPSKKLSYEDSIKAEDTSEPVKIVRFNIRKNRWATSFASAKHGIAPWVVDCFFFAAWVMFAYTAVVPIYLHYKELPVQGIHSVELLVAVIYFTWGALLLSVQLSGEVRYLPSDTPFGLAYKKAELSTTRLTLTQIVDGRQINTTGVGFLQMVCRLHTASNAWGASSGLVGVQLCSMLLDVNAQVHANNVLCSQLKNAVNDVDVLDALSQSFASWLSVLWKQEDVKFSLPWMQAGKVDPIEAVESFSCREPETCQQDWDHNNEINSRSMQTQLDLGVTRWTSEIVLGVLALLNSLLGMFHRYAIEMPPCFFEPGNVVGGNADNTKRVSGTTTVDGLAIEPIDCAAVVQQIYPAATGATFSTEGNMIGCFAQLGALTDVKPHHGSSADAMQTCIFPDSRDSSHFLMQHNELLQVSTFCVLFVGSFVVYRTLFRTAFRLYMVLAFCRQMSAALVIDEAKGDRLPCFLDLQHDGNLEAWYRARSFLLEYVDVYVFGESM
eukprot:COSAG01_NODE_721_length_14068_cov_479.648436_4_plen_735_part_00